MKKLKNNIEEKEERNCQERKAPRKWASSRNGFLFSKPKIHFLSQNH
jgi:hypothetical protein